MWPCVICRFLVELDDVLTRIGPSRCVCLRCFVREVGGGLPPLKDWYRAALREAVNVV